MGKPAIATLLLGLLLMLNFISAFAASGGRMGGRSFSSQSRRSSSLRRSSSWSSSRSYSSRSSLCDSSSPYYWTSSRPGSTVVCRLESETDYSSIIFATFIAFGVIYLVGYCSRESDGETSVLKLQVGLLGLRKSLQKDLNRIAETADTSTSKGFHYILTETAVVLLRYSDYCISAYSSIDMKDNVEEGEKGFHQLCTEERAKFDEETLVNVNNVKKQSSTILRSTGPNNEHIVITILVAAKGKQTLPPIDNSEDLKVALQGLASLPLCSTLAVEVLWTPQIEDDTLSEEELLKDYPLLRPL